MLLHHVQQQAEGGGGVLDAGAFLGDGDRSSWVNVGRGVGVWWEHDPLSPAADLELDRDAEVHRCYSAKRRFAAEHELTVLAQLGGAVAPGGTFALEFGQQRIHPT